MGCFIFISVADSVSVHIVGITIGEILQALECFGLRPLTNKFNTEIETKCVLLWTWVHVTEIGVPRDLIYHKCDAFWYLLTYFFFLKLSHSWVEACNLRPLYEGYKGEGPLGVYRMAVYINIRNAKQIVTTGGGMGTSCWESKLCVASWRWNISRGSRISRRKQKGRESRGKE